MTFLSRLQSGGGHDCRRYASYCRHAGHDDGLRIRRESCKGARHLCRDRIFVVSFLLLERFQLHPALVIMLFLAYGTVHFRTVAKLKNKDGIRRVRLMEEWPQLLVSFCLQRARLWRRPRFDPLMYKEIVTHHGWLTDPEFSNMLALATRFPVRSPPKSPLCRVWRIRLDGHDPRPRGDGHPFRGSAYLAAEFAAEIPHVARGQR